MRFSFSRLSLSQKMSLSMLALVLVLAVGAGLYMLPAASRAFAEQEQELGSLLPTVLASALSSMIATGHQHTVQEMVDDAARGDALAYVTIFDAKGGLLALAGPYAEEVGARLDSLPVDRGAGIIVLRGAEMIDLHAPVDGGKGGHVHVGLGMGAVRARSLSVGSRFVQVAVACVIVLVGAAMMLGRRLTSHLNHLSQVANRIAEGGDLTMVVPVTSEDEVGQLARSFASMVSRLKAVLLQLRESSDLLSQAVRALDQSAHEQNQMVTRHAAALQQTQLTAQRIRQVSELAATSAEDVLRVAQRADELGRVGEDAIALTVEGLVELRSEAAQISERISDLGHRTDQIGGITETVKDLADQSNMLAINAAIEAARSGEEGKGFEVVAREIRGLADQSIRATGQVREILVDISSAIDATVRISEQGTRRMETGLMQVRASGESLRELSMIVRDSSGSVRQIAQLVDQQNSGISQIFTAITDLNGLMEDTVRRIEATSTSAATLKQLSERVSEVLRPYRV